jgi:hypothetical protein
MEEQDHGRGIPAFSLKLVPPGLDLDAISSGESDRAAGDPLKNRGGPGVAPGWPEEEPLRE